MTRLTLSISSPVLLALSLVAAVSLSARVYRDHSLTQQVLAGEQTTEEVSVAGK